MKLLILILIIIPSAFALEAVVTVLETPMLSEPRYDAKAVQYLRKGDIIKLHPSLNKLEDYDHLAPSEEKFKALDEKIKSSEEWNQDPLFKGEMDDISIEDEFVPALDRQGHKVYLIRDHLYIYFSNRKELTQGILTKDPTDYRLQEPLPRKYPLAEPQGYRGQFTLGLTQPYQESYDYDQSFKAKGYTIPLDLNISFLRQAPHDLQNRLYFGITFNFRYHKNEYLFFDGRTSEESSIRFGLGPIISYETYKEKLNRLNLYGSVNFNLFNQTVIKQSDQNNSESKIFRTYNLAPRIGIQYFRKAIFEDIDFVAGTYVEMEPATTFRSKNSSSQSSWWRSSTNDKFYARTTFSLAGHLGVQAAY